MEGAGLSESGEFSLRYAWKLQEIKKKNGLDGSETTIAILDTKVNWESGALAKKKSKVEHNMLPRTEDVTIDSTENGTVCAKPWEHGTVCATAAAGGRFDNKSVGVAPKADLISYQVAKDVNSFSSAAILKALEHIRQNFDKTRVDVVLMSLAFKGTNDEEDKLQEIIEKLSKLGVILVAAAGNYGKYCGAELPASLPQVISVGGLDKFGDALKSTPPPEFITVFAPGVYSVPPADSRSGTSIAAAAVAGLVSLLIQCVKKLFPTEPKLIDRLRKPTVLKRIFSDHMTCDTLDYEWEKKFPYPHRFFKHANADKKWFRDILTDEASSFEEAH